MKLRHAAPSHDATLDVVPVVFDPDDIPLDEITDVPDDGATWRDLKLPFSGGVLKKGIESNTSLPPKAKLVPFYRVIGLGSKPDMDVVAVKRAVAVWAAHARHPEWFPWKKTWTTVPGPLLGQALARFQKRHNLPVTRRYDRKTHDLLAPFFDAYGIRLLAQYPHSTPRDRVVAEAFWGYHNRASIHYLQLRPIDGHDRLHKLPLYTDCSGAVTDWYEWGKAADPNGFGFNGLGYTGTLQNHGRVVSLVQVQPGDLCFYGVDPGGAAHHVTIAVSKARCISHGTEDGPSLLPLGPAIGGTLHSVHSYL